ncbi:MAG: hypothetical protein MUP24_13575 [Gillisia sp.]|nr:hypothetical protein [Gillisia sp.]
MKKLLIFTFVFIGFISSTLGQDLNSYKYVLVPSSFEFLKEPNQYQLNELTKFLFEKYGFEAYVEDEELPMELSQNRCKALIANVKNNSGLFSTKLVVVLKDCKNNELFISKEGSSREKVYKTAYQEALRDAFESIAALNYKYEGEVSAAPAPKSENVVQLVIVPETKADTTEQEIMPAEVEVSIIPVSKDQIVENSKNENTFNFLYEAKAFYLERSENGYRFFQKGMTEPFAQLIVSKTGQTYFYASITTQGIATFDEDGNLVVEIFNRENTSIDTKIYKLQN